MLTGNGGGPQRGTVTDIVRYRILQSALLLLTICFVAQVFSPLRLNGDAIVLLSMADSAAHGDGFFDGGQKTVFPPAYPALLAVLIKAGLAHSWGIIGLNVVLLALGLFAAYTLLIREFFADKTIVLSLCSFFLLSFVVIKHFTIPLTDVPFFCCSTCCLAVMSQARKIDWNWRFVVLVVAAWVLAVAAIAVRRIGVALVPSLVFMMMSSPQFKSFLKDRRTKLIAALIAALAGAALICLIAKTSTLSDFIGAANKLTLPTLVFRILSYRLTEFGELLVNVPISKMPTLLHAMVPWVGLVSILLTFFGLTTKRRGIGPTEMFLVCYTGILFAWPYYDTRFWLPVIPLLVAYSALSVKRLRLPFCVVTIYCVVFAVFGFIAIAYSTRITFAGSKFPDRYGDGNLRSTYCSALQSCPDGGNSKKVDAKVLRLLRQYN